jgi:hypothetical protein
MALHRDIYWVGRQWAVTGAGIQAVDQRLRGVLDIEIGRLWDDDLVQSRRAKPGVNVADFDKALSVARERFPGASATVPAPVQIAEQPLTRVRAEAPAAAPVPPAMQLRAEGRLARFLPQWRVRR